MCAEKRLIMSLDAISSSINTYSKVDTKKADSTKETAATVAASTKNTSSADKAASTDTSKENGVVFDKTTDNKTDSANQIYNKDAIISKLKADQQSRLQSMQNLVEKLLNKQKGTFDLASLMKKDDVSGLNLSATFEAAAKNADPDTIKAAQESISEDGYWGVNKTSDRLVSMAIALSGGDTDKADEMMSAIQKGYDRATAAWGKDLPDICKDTLEATSRKWMTGKTARLQQKIIQTFSSAVYFNIIKPIEKQIVNICLLIIHSLKLTFISKHIFNHQGQRCLQKDMLCPFLFIQNQKLIIQVLFLPYMLFLCILLNKANNYKINYHLLKDCIS